MNRNKKLLAACKTGNIKEVKYLLSKKGYFSKININKVDDEEGTPLIAASIRGHIEILKQLVASGADVDKESNKGATPLAIASLGVVKHLITSKADANKADKDGFTPLMAVSMEGQAEIATYIGRNGSRQYLKRRDKLINKMV